MVNKGLLEVFGEDFESKYYETLKSKRLKRLDITTEEAKKDLFGFITKNIKPEQPTLKYTKDGYDYHVMLLETPENLEIKSVKYGVMFKTRFLGDFITIFLNADRVQILEPLQTYIFVGRIKQSMWNGRVQHSFNTQVVITMAELAEFKKENFENNMQIDEALEEHKK